MRPLRKELNTALARDFPNLYRAGPYVGPDVGDGWQLIVRRLSEKLESLIAALPKNKRNQYCAIQIKEKYGGLRFYMSIATEQMYDAIRAAEDESYRTCERCGEPGVLRGQHWLFTACDVHSRGEAPTSST